MPEPGDSCGQIHPSLPTSRRSPVDRSLVAKALNPSLFRHACRMAIAVMPVLSLISRNSPKQFGMVSPELDATFVAEPLNNACMCVCQRDWTKFLYLI